MKSRIPKLLPLLLLTSCHEETYQTVLQNEIHSYWMGGAKSETLRSEIRTRIQNFLRNEAENRCEDYSVRWVGLGAAEPTVEVLSSRREDTRTHYVHVLDCLVWIDFDRDRTIDFEDVFEILENIGYQISELQVARRGIVRIRQPKAGGAVDVRFTRVTQLAVRVDPNIAPTYRDALEQLRRAAVADARYLVYSGRAIRDGISDAQEAFMCSSPTLSDYARIEGLYLDEVIEEAFRTAFGGA